MKKPEARKQVKVLVGIINKEDENRFSEIINECATAVHFSGIGHGTASELEYLHGYLRSIWAPSALRRLSMSS